MKDPHMSKAKNPDEKKNYCYELIDNSGLMDNFLAKQLSISRITFWRKKREAHTFTLEELVVLADFLRIDWKKLAEGIISERKVSPDLYTLPPKQD